MESAFPPDPVEADVVAVERRDVEAARTALARRERVNVVARRVGSALVESGFLEPAGTRRCLAYMTRGMMKTLVDGAAPLLARVLLCLVFIPAAISKTFDWPGNAAYMRAHGMPLISLFLGAALVVEALGSLSVVLGWYARPAALVMAAYLVPVSLVFHRLGSSAFAQTQLLKNLGIIGGLLLIAVHGAGPWSIDVWRRRRRFGQPKVDADDP